MPVFCTIEHEKRKQKWDMPNTHYHNHYEIYYLISGKTRYLIGDSIYNVNAGDMIFIPKGTIHKTAQVGEKPIERLLISFSEDYCEDKKLLRCFDNVKISYVGINELVMMIKKENESRDEFSGQMIKAYVTALLISVNRFIEGNTETKENTDEVSGIISEVVKYINANFSSEITLELLAAKFALSPSYLSRKFKRGTGMGLKEYITMVRIKNSEEILLSTKLSVTETAIKCGFGDSCYFTSVFRKFKGVSPQKFRKIYLKQVAEA